MSEKVPAPSLQAHWQPAPERTPIIIGRQNKPSGSDSAGIATHSGGPAPPPPPGYVHDSHWEALPPQTRMRMPDGAAPELQYINDEGHSGDARKPASDAGIRPASDAGRRTDDARRTNRQPRLEPHTLE